MNASDVLILGGGVIGLTVALACADRGARVGVLTGERPPTTLAAGGMLCPSFEAAHEGGRTLAALGGESLALWDDHAARVTDGVPMVIDYRRGGVVGVGYPPGFLKGASLPVPQGVQADAAVLVPEEGQVDPRRLMTALDRRLTEIGVERHAVTATELLREGGRVVGAAAGGARFLAARTILATGAGTGLAPQGLIEPVRGRAFAARLPDDVVFDLPGADVLRAPAVYVCRKADGVLYVGATEELRPADAVLDGLWHEACWLIPALRRAERLSVFDGMRPGTRSGLPVLRAAEEGLFLALGHHRNGVLLAPVTAARAAAWALG